MNNQVVETTVNIAAGNRRSSIYTQKYYYVVIMYERVEKQTIIGKVTTEFKRDSKRTRNFARAIAFAKAWVDESNDG